MDSNLECEYCGNCETHEFATILEPRLKEDTGTTQITIMNIDNKISITQLALDDTQMKHRRNNTFHLFSCEQCAAVRSICVYQHKGLTLIEEEFPKTIPDILNLKYENNKYKYLGIPICNDGW